MTKPCGATRHARACLAAVIGHHRSLVTPPTHNDSRLPATPCPEFATGFNASQSDYRLVPVYKGSYPESMTAAIAAFRAGNAPHIVQVFEVDTATMMSTPGAIKPVHQLMQEAGEKFDPKAYVSAVAGYYTDRKGRMLSMPFNSSTTVFYVNKDAFRKTGLDPNKAPTTWKEFGITAGKLKASGQSCVYKTGWPSWVHAENFSVWHNLPLSGKTIAALFVIQFIYGWNQYLWPLLITTREDMYTTVIGIRRMIVGGDALTEWPLVMATAMLAMLPPALVVLVMQKWFVQGLVDSEK